MHNFSLAAFTLLAQGAVGLIWCLLAVSWPDPSVTGPLFLPAFYISLGMTVFSLLIALCHLGNPKNAPYAVSNVIHSRLSREIIAVHLFAAGLLGLWVLTRYGSHIHWQRLGDLLVFLLGAGAVWTIARVYRLTAVPAWNHWGTPLDFLGSALLTGGGILFVVQWVTADQSPEVALECLGCIAAGGALKMVSLALFMKHLSASRTRVWYLADREKLADSRAGCRFRLSAYPVCVALFLIAGVMPDQWVFPLCLMAVTGTLAVEIWKRICFYRAFCRVGV